jgi:hypothetical protein
MAAGPLVRAAVAAAVSFPTLHAQQFSALPRLHLPLLETDGQSVAAGDLDGDLDVDLVFPRNFNAPLVYRNQGNARFVANSSGMPTGPSSTGASRLVDVDGDGDPDLVMTRSGTRPLLWRNDGGTFVDVSTTAMPAVSTHFSPNGIVPADIDGDGDLDLLCTGNGLLLLVNGGGTFTNGAARIPSLPLATGEAAAADFDGDGHVDFAVARLSAAAGQRHLLLRNDGTGYFTDLAATHLPPLAAGEYPGALSLAAADVDGDADVDIVTSQHADDLVLYRNQGGGTFQLGEPIPVLGVMHAPWVRVPDRLRLGDVDGDGDPDLVCLAAGPYGRHLYYNDGTGVFAPSPPAALPQARQPNRGQLLVDVDDDGDLDLVQASPSLSSDPWRELAHAVLLNDGDGRFVDLAENAIDHTADDPLCLAAVDFDRDGLVDLLRGVGTATSPTPRGQLWPLRSSGAQSFVELAPVAFDQTLGRPRTLAIGDVDGDGWPDCYASFDTGANLLLRNHSGTLAPGGSLPTGPTRASAAEFGDFDGDGDLDLLTARLVGEVFDGSPRQTEFWQNDGAGNFVDATAGRMPPLLDRCSAMAVFDLERDGDLDVFLAVISSTSTVEDRLLVNDGTGHFTNEPWRMPPSGSGYTDFVRAADLDGDGDTDLVLQRSSLRIWLADGAGALVEASSQWNPFGYSAGDFVVADFDGDGRIDVLRTGYRALLRNTGTQLSNVASPFANAYAVNVVLGMPVIGDFDGDGDPDCAFGNADHYNVQWNLRRQTSLPYVAKPGTDLTIRVHADPGSAGAVRIAAVAVSASRAPAAAPTPFGGLWLDPNEPLLLLQGCVLPAPAGSGDVALWIPPWWFLQGVALTAQSLVLDGDTAAAALTNAITTTIR